MIIWSLDTESYYDKDFSITTMGAWNYVFHPSADHYLVSVVGSNGDEFVGKPEDAPWGKMVNGIWLSWNAAYDCLVIQRLIRDGRIPNVAPKEWHDPSDMVAYLGYPRSLKAAVEALYKVPLSKDVRDKMKGKRWNYLAEEFRRQVMAYALNDAKWPLRIWQDYSDKWPEHERKLSRLTREIAWNGVRVDVDRVERGIRLMKLLCWAAEQKIPWADDSPALSYPKLVEQCRLAGIEAPSSVALGDEGCEIWEQKYGEQYLWVAAMRIKRRCNVILKKLETIRSRVREDGTIPIELKYAGAYPSLRWSGTGQINFQNLPREPLFDAKWWNEEGKRVIGDLVSEVPEGVDLRACLISREGYKFAICDLDQIEPRCGAFLVKDEKSLEILKAGHSPYDAHAVVSGLAKMEELPLKNTYAKRYLFAKATKLALTYGSGHHKLLQMAPLYGLDNEVFLKPVTDEQIREYEQYLNKCKDIIWTSRWRQATEEGKTMIVNAWMITTHYRNSDIKVVSMWRDMQNALKQSVGEDMMIVLPSGRPIIYRKIAYNSDLTAVILHFGKLSRQKVYGSLCYNHIVQGMARDVFAEAMLRVHDAGYKIVLHVHDELVCEIPENESSDEIARIMSESPSWAKPLPVSASVTESKFYKK